MDETVLQEILDELFSTLEASETQNGAMLSFLKNRGVVSEEEFAPFLEGAAKASNVRWRATRARVNYLLSKAPEATEVSQETSSSANETKKNQYVAQQSPEEHKDSVEGERTAEKPERDSRTEDDKDAPRQDSDSNPTVEERTADKPAKKDAAEARTDRTSSALQK